MGNVWVVDDLIRQCSILLFCQQKTTSVARRVTSAHRVILPAPAAAATTFTTTTAAAAAATATSNNHHRNISDTSSCTDVKSRLREVLLRGNRRQQPQNGNCTVCHYYSRRVQYCDECVCECLCLSARRTT